jgi:site-specific recombinase XerD
VIRRTGVLLRRTALSVKIPAVPRRSPPSADLRVLLPSWELHLRAERKSPQTIKAYGDGVRRFLSWCEVTRHAAVLDRPTVTRFVAELLDAGAEPATARSRQLALRRFSAWLVDEDELPTDLLAGMRPPRLDQKVVHPLSDEQLRALIAACKGPELRDRRDEAVVRLMLETGARAGEVVGLTVADVDLASGTVLIRRGKGGKGRPVPVGPHAGRSLDRYLRARRSHRLAETPALWLGDRGKEFSYFGLHAALRARARSAGIFGFHPHLLRHTAAHRWLAAGGSEAGLMAVAGWTRPDMLLRYTRAQAAERAAAEARRLNLGDL